MKVKIDRHQMHVMLQQFLDHPHADIIQTDAEPIDAPEWIKEFDMKNMDGWFICTRDASSISTWKLRCLDDIKDFIRQEIIERMIGDYDTLWEQDDYTWARVVEEIKQRWLGGSK